MGSNSEYFKRRRLSFIERGLCSACGKHPRTETSTICQACSQKQRLTNKKVQARYRAKGLCAQCGKRKRQGMFKVCSLCLKRTREHGLAYRQRMRAAVFSAYGGAKCACCGETNIEFLTLDHINGGGTAHRKEVGAGDKMYRWLRDKGYPPGYRVLCFNCNYAIFRYKICPHQRAIRSSAEEVILP